MSTKTNKVRIRRCTIVLVPVEEEEKERSHNVESGAFGGMYDAKFRCARGW